MDTRITLLPMTEAYAPGAARLDQITFPGEAWSEEAFLREARTPSSFYVVAVLGEEVVGFAGMQQVLDEGYITNIAVAESCRRKGLGRAMLSALIDHCGRAEPPSSPWKCGSPTPPLSRSMNPWASSPRDGGRISTVSPPRTPF